MGSCEEANLKPPSDDPTTYCRLCLSLTELRPLASASDPLDLIQQIWKQLGIQLSEPDEFPCAVCTLCVEKLEELFECNDDGLLDEWEDEGLLAYKRNCLMVDLAIRNWRCAAGTAPVQVEGNRDRTVVLPFQQLGDGRYRCNECPDLVFDVISACIRHYQENHPDSSVMGLSMESNNSAFQGNATNKQAFDCVNCTAQFSNIDDLIAHRETHSTTKRTNVELSEATTNGNDGHNSSDGSATGNSAISGNTDKKRPCFKCVSCGDNFDSIDNLIQHRYAAAAANDPKHKVVQSRKQPRGKPYRKRFITADSDTKCRECNVEFPDKKAFYVHLNAIHDLNICNICDKSFSAPSLLINHQSYHRNLDDIINPFLLGKHSFHCKVCFDKFRSEREIRLHYQIKHVEPESGNHDNGNDSVVVPSVAMRITCSRCFATFDSNELLEGHYGECRDQGSVPESESYVNGIDSVVVPSAAMRITCSRCFASFDSNEHLEEHYSECRDQGSVQKLSEAVVDIEDEVVEISDEENLNC